MSSAIQSWRQIGVVALVAVLTAALGAAAVTVVPSVWAAAATEVATESTTRVLAEDGASVRIPVEEGWWWQPAFGDASRATLTTPDGGMSIDLRLRVDIDPDTAVGEAAWGPLGPLDREPAGAGRLLLHAPVEDADAVAGALVIDGDVLVFLRRSAPEYDAELARLIARVAVAQ